MGVGGRDEEVASIKRPNLRLECKNRYPIYDQKGLLLKNHTLWDAHTQTAHIRGNPLPGICGHKQISSLLELPYGNWRPERLMYGVKRSIDVHCVVLLSQVGSLFFFVLFFMT